MNNELVYGVKIEYQEHSIQPAQVFYAMGNLIESMKNLDDALIDSLPHHISNEIILESVETGSLITKLKVVLENIDDDALKELSIKKLIGAFLVKGKHKVLEKLYEKDRITDSEDFDILVSSIEEVGHEELRELEIEPKISKSKLLQAFNAICESLKYLSENENAYYISSEGVTGFNKKFSLG